MVAFPTLRLVYALAIALLGVGCSGDGAASDPCAAVGRNGCTADGAASFICVNGVYRERPCTGSEVCAAAQCRPVVCKPGLFLCDGSVADVCDPTGTLHTRTDCAEMGADCVVGPLAASCVQHTCAPATTYCAPDGSEVRKCALDGSHYDVVERCDDPGQRGVTCAGAACHDRCALVEAQDRSTVGCRFMTASLSARATLLIANAQDDLPATVELGGPASMSRTVPPGGSVALDWPAIGASGSSVAARAIAIRSSVPVQAWLLDGGEPVSLHPEHALGARTLVGVGASPGESLQVIATVDGTQVALAARGAIDAGPGVAATAAGSTLSVTLARGQVLTARSPGLLDGSRVQASAPVAVIASNAAGHLALPADDALGLELITAGRALLVARDDGTVVTTDLDGTTTLQAGATLALSGAERVHSSAPVLLIDQGGADGHAWLAPVDQWLDHARVTFPAGAGSATLTLLGEQPEPIAAGGQPLALLVATGTWATASVSISAGVALSGPAPFLAFARPSIGVYSAGYGLRSLHP